jgi:hypothetical protein
MMKKNNVLLSFRDHLLSRKQVMQKEDDVLADSLHFDFS